MKRKPTAIIYDPDVARRAALGEIVARKLNCTAAACSLEEKLGTSADAFFIGNGTKLEKVTAIAKNLRQKYPDSQRVLVTDKPLNHHNTLLLNDGTYTHVLYTAAPDSFFRNFRKTPPWRSARIGFLGYGNFFQEIYPMISGSLSAEVLLFSNHLSRKGYSPVAKWAEEEKIICTSSPAELIRERPEIIIVENARHQNSREKNTLPSLARINEVSSELAEYIANNGIVCIMNNTPGPCCLSLFKYAKEHEFGGDELAKRITGFTADSQRARAHLAETLQIPQEGLDVPVFLEHGDCMADLEQATLSGNLLAKSMPGIKNSQFSESFNKHLNSMGKSAYISASQTGSGYHMGTSKAVAAAVCDVIEGKTPQDSVYCHYTAGEIAVWSGKALSGLSPFGAFLLSPAAKGNEGFTHSIEKRLSTAGEMIRSKAYSAAHNQNKYLQLPARMAA